MKNIFLPKDIKSGMLLIKETSPKNSIDTSFACTVTYKIGFGYFGPGGTGGEENRAHNQQYCLISVATDGMVFPIGFTKDCVADYLNKDEAGYRPLTRDEFVRIVDSNTEQLFY